MKNGVSRGEYPLGSGFPIGASSTLLAHDFPSGKSSVLYLLLPLVLKRGRRHTGQTVSVATEVLIYANSGLAEIRTSSVGEGRKARAISEAVRHHRGAKGI